MKKIILSSLFSLMTIFVIGQTAPREMVALEIGTGTWCQYCPGAAMGADDLLEAGCLVAVIENHNGDVFANTYSNNRNSYYAITGYPTAVFDGIIKVVGGSHTSSMFSSYLPRYNNRIQKPSPLAMSMVITNNGLDYTAVITVEKIGSITATSLKLHFFITQSNIAYNWQGQNHLNFVNRKMVPDQNGTDVSFISGNTQTYILNYTLDSAWPVEDVEFIAFVQDHTGKEVQQCIKKGAIDLNVDFQASATQINKGDPVTFSNLTTGGYINALELYHWEFPGGTPDTSNIKDPVVIYNECGPHDVSLVVWRGGQSDTVVKTAYIQVGPFVTMTAIPNDTTCWYVPITLDATTPDATYLWSPGGETTPTIQVTHAQYGYGAHTFFCTVTTSDGCVNELEQTVVLDECLGIDQKNNDFNVSIYPNPNNGTFTLTTGNPDGTLADLKVINTLGALVYQEKDMALDGNRTIKISNMVPGMYTIILQNGERKSIQKFMVK